VPGQGLAVVYLGEVGVHRQKRFCFERLQACSSNEFALGDVSLWRLPSPWPDASGSSPSPRASTVRPDRIAVAVLRHSPLKAETCMHCKTLPGEWLLNFNACSNEFLWESLAQNKCIIDAFL
jgi:hypothetical protein